MLPCFFAFWALPPKSSPILTANPGWCMGFDVQCGCLHRLSYFLRETKPAPGRIEGIEPKYKND
jgi:hypothetical protein